MHIHTEYQVCDANKYTCLQLRVRLCSSISIKTNLTHQDVVYTARSGPGGRKTPQSSHSAVGSGGLPMCRYSSTREREATYAPDFALDRRRHLVRVRLRVLGANGARPASLRRRNNVFDGILRYFLARGPKPHDYTLVWWAERSVRRLCCCAPPSYYYSCCGNCRPRGMRRACAGARPIIGVQPLLYKIKMRIG